MTDDLKLNLPSDKGAQLGIEIARLYQSAENSLRVRGKVIPERCWNCATRLGSLPNQCEETLFRFMLAGVENDPFMCHHANGADLSFPFAEGCPVDVCAGYRVIMMDAGRDAILETAIKSVMEEESR